MKQFFRGSLIGWMLLITSIHLVAQDNLKNLPELSMPISNKKLVIAHCMTNIIRYKGHKLEDSCDPEYYATKGNSTASLGGLTQVKVMTDSLLKDKTLEETVEFEMRTAMQSGIDGFQFYYVLGAPDWDEIIKAYFRVADKQQLDFKLTLCVSHPGGSTEEAKIAELARRMNGIFNEVGRNNPHWLRTPDGRLLLYLWYGESLADIPADRQGLPESYYVARAYKRLGDAVNEKFALARTINERIDEQKANEYLDYFPAVWMWTVSFTNDYAGKVVADACRKRNRSFMGSAFNDFYTSKLLKRGTWDMFHYASEAVSAGINKVERKYIATGLSWNFRKMLEFGIAEDVSIMNIITWNDYPEGHHLAPEINHNDGFSLLLKYYKSIWKKESSPYQDNDIAIAFFKKYRHDIDPAPYNIPVESFQQDAVQRKEEDSIEVVTILQDKAQLMINDKMVQVPAGFTVSRIVQQKGAVRVAIIRNGITLKKFVTPGQITNKPIRADRLTYSWSTETDHYRRSILGALSTTAAAVE
ncbi:endo-1,3-alpha-glucanase family glycosylhydrolase [Paraflavitalea soli]|nr:endo-1,3-alpha-glucanase family glycosylhydrolase [Paraflavitalea soli]